jgi:Sec-independent protein translocase protein TatA
MDLIIVLVLVLIIVLLWRGPRTLPQLGAMFGRGVRAARDEADRMRTTGDHPAKDDDAPSP